VPQNFSTLLLEKYRIYGNSLTHKNAFRYFATRILPAVNASHTRFDKRKYTKVLSQCFNYTDEAFGILMVANYEERWTTQYTALITLPGGSRREHQDLWEDARYTIQQRAAGEG
jgi:hypothetical protein